MDNFPEVDCAVSIAPIAPAFLGQTVSIRCELTNEVGITSFVFWRRYDGYGTTQTSLDTSLPTRYAITTTVANASYTLSVLRITGIIAQDFASFECSWGSSDRKNLTEAR